MLKKDKLILEKYNGIHPICLCGCGEQTNYEYKLKDFHKWKHGHQSRIPGHFGDPKAKKRVDAIIKTRKEKFASGEYDHILNKVSQNRSEKTKQKISKSGKGVSRPKAEGFGTGRIHSQKTKDKMSKSAIQRILKTGKVKRSGLEYKFEGLLESLEIKYIHSYYIESIGKIYDFYLPEYNILIEVDGDFWHCNPETHIIPECKTQEINIENDKFKTQWAIDNGYRLLRFWENDINNNIKQVKQVLLEALNK
jgi:very-short-patch-repair endonuclease